jgi:hypothetical protein
MSLGSSHSAAGHVKFLREASFGEDPEDSKVERSVGKTRAAIA